MTNYTVRIEVRVDDEQSLYEAAQARAVEDGLLQQGEALLWRDGKIDPGACLQMLFDPGMSPPGMTIIESEVAAVETTGFDLV